METQRALRITEKNSTNDINIFVHIILKDSFLRVSLCSPCLRGYTITKVEIYITFLIQGLSLYIQDHFRNLLKPHNETIFLCDYRYLYHLFFGSYLAIS